MEYIKNSNGNDINYILYPQARYKDNVTTNYSNTNNVNYSKISLTSRSIENENNTFDPIAKEMSNNITLEFNSRVENANKLNEALEIIRKSVADEAEDVALYNMMINQAMQDEDKEILTSIVNDEQKHNMMLRQIYFSLTGINLPSSKENTMNNENTYINNLRKSLFGELEAAKKYRKVLSSMSDKENYNKLMEIMIDELTHANKFNYLITKYMINHEEGKNMK